MARLYDCYPGQVVPGVIGGDKSWQEYPHFYKVYVPGVGSPFEQVGDKNDSSLGAAAAKYGHERIAWGLMQALNNIHRYFLGAELFPKARILEISRKLVLTGWHLKKERWLSQREIEQGQQSSYDVLRGALGELHKALPPFMYPQGGEPANKAKGKVGRIHVSVFGFSRGATKARSFLNWLRKLCQLDAELLGGASEFTLAGFPVVFDFLGLFDTVASVGLASSSLLFDGHAAWADAEVSLRVPPGVKCVHLVAGHEIRRSFPLDSIQVGGSLGSGCEEIMFPGVHSDVGGGYLPKEQGRGVDQKGADMLSRLPLGVMYRKARLAGVPLKAEKLDPAIQYRMEADPQVIEHFNAYLKTLPAEPGEFKNQLMAMYLPYLAWRLSWADCKTRDSLRARIDNLAGISTADMNDLLGGNLKFIEHLGYYRRWANEEMVRVGRDQMRRYNPPTLDGDMLRNWAMLKKELPCLHDNQKPYALPEAASKLFQYLVHDSYAWFRLTGKEESEMLTYLERKSQVPADSLSKTEQEWVARYKETKAAGRAEVPESTTDGQEWFFVGGGYLHLRRVYAGADDVRLAKNAPQGEDSTVAA
ncbi:protein of unknown function [Pseudogulbenkiania sp. NH8B]|nr:protein of unknown function [Pseudogulbenkiania sp. NH8B]